MELSEEDLARFIRQAVMSAVAAAVTKTRTTGVLSGTVEQIDSEDLDIAFVRMDNEAMSGDPTESLNYEMPGVIPATRRGQTFDGDQVRLDFNGTFGADAMQVGVQKRIVLPYGAESGPRVIIEGDDGSILVYDLSGDLYGSITPTDGFAVFNPADPAVFVRLDTLAGSPIILFNSGDADEATPGFLNEVLNSPGGGSGNDFLELALTTGTGGFADRGRLVLASESRDGSAASYINVDAADLRLLGVPISRGILDPFFRATSNDSARAAGVNTDMTTTVELIAGHTYRVHAHSQFNVGTVAQVYALECDYDGTVIGRFGRWSAAETPTGSATCHVDGSVTFTASGDDAAATFTVQNSAGSGGTVTMTAGATNPRTLTVEHVGAP